MQRLQEHKIVDSNWHMNPLKVWLYVVRVAEEKYEVHKHVCKQTKMEESCSCPQPWCLSHNLITSFAYELLSNDATIFFSVLSLSSLFTCHFLNTLNEMLNIN